MKMTCLCSTLLLTASAWTGAQAQSYPQPVDPPVETTVIVRSAGTGYTPSGPPPSFAALDQNGDLILTEAEASGYKLLANDYLKADSNENGTISKSEYERWAAQP